MAGQAALAAYVGRGWTGARRLAFIHKCIRYLGIEAYGLDRGAGDRLVLAGVSDGRLRRVR